jgi:hypothetical protein
MTLLGGQLRLTTFPSARAASQRSVVVSIVLRIPRTLPSVKAN